MTTATVESIVLEYLKNHAFDGLAGDHCGCGIDDFMPCGGDWSSMASCSPAERVEYGTPRCIQVEECEDRDDECTLLNPSGCWRVV